MKVSLVMAVYNGEAYLKETIDSMLAQTYSDLEIIIVNDGSTDSTSIILNKIKDSRVRLIELASNSGVANALNIAIEQAQGDWIAIHDSDDISLPNRIEEQVNHLINNPQLIATGSFVECFTDIDAKEINIARIKNLQNYKNSIITSAQIKAELFKGCPLIHGSLLMSKEAFYKVGKYDTGYRIASDYDLLMRLAAVGPIENTTKVLYKYRVSLNSLSNSDVKETSNEFLLASTKYIRKYCFPMKKHSPRVVVYGTAEGCLAFKDLMFISKNLQVCCMLSEFQKKEIFKLYKEYRRGLIDAFIVLTNAPQEEQLLKFLKGKGFEINIDYFTLWSAL